ncbi:GNAT family N-acetyltransferase [Halonatronum saccharophilum]|uniref:GNAT family N-acetyltransferase n=1 Tax=Halonatronum saccharophilum TaxID=150060 RepID=UPI000487609B|nr:GNAT family N-acetyltransferase [Halonatronum saccharophilum]
MYKLTPFERRVQREMSKIIDVPFNLKDVEIITKKEYEKDKKISIYQMKLNSLIITPPSLYDNLVERIDQSGIVSRVDINQLKSMMGLDKHRVEDRTVYLFLNPSDYKGSFLGEKYIISKLDKSYDKEFKVFKSECSKRDLDEGLVSLDDPIVYGCFDNHKLVGVASFWLWGEKIGDIGVVVHPDYRRQSIGKALVSKLSNWGINNQRISLYRHTEKNLRSHELALSLNFKKHLVVEDMRL